MTYAPSNRVSLLFPIRRTARSSAVTHTPLDERGQRDVHRVVPGEVPSGRKVGRELQQLVSVSHAGQTKCFDQMQRLLYLGWLTSGQPAQHREQFVHEQLRHQVRRRIALDVGQDATSLNGQGFVGDEPLDRHRCVDDDHDRRSRSTSRVVPVVGGLNFSCRSRATTSRRCSSASRSTNRSR